MSDLRHLRLEIEGIVQGVGFRPFLHRLAQETGLAGWCRNTTFGVELEVEGTEDALSRFQSALTADLPPLARITALRSGYSPVPEGYEGFHIRPSRRNGSPDLLISPDIATCPACLRELRDPADRRYRYPFINCTDCGPRFTIIKGLPYDRERTSMSRFPMCPDCAAEYGDLSTRRYHAQPDCCPVCGPRLIYRDGSVVTDDPIAAAQAALAEGKIVAVKGLGGYHLACLPERTDIVRELRRRKHRDERPFAIMCRDLEAVRSLCFLSPQEEAVLVSPRAPIVLLEKRQNAPCELTDTRELGIMMPYTPVHHLLMEPFPALVMTSLNRSDQPTCLDESDAVSMALADGILTHDREIVNRCDDSLLRVFRGKEFFFRRSRGYVPEPVGVTADCGGILACGGEQKASFGLSRSKNVFLSPHIGDLKNLATLDHYTHQIALYEQRFGVTVNRLVCDLHPDYLSTGYARERSRKERLPLTAVQHHHAHMASCMADNGLEGNCLGLIWDGTGYGTDGTIWGGECLAGDYSSFTRLSSLRPIPLPGGDRCAREIWRTGFSLLWDAGLAACCTHPQAPLLSQMRTADLNCPPSSGMGRLFDGVYYLLSGRETVSYEGQGAIALETMAEPDDGLFSLSFFEEEGLSRFDTRPLVREIMTRLDEGISPAVLASRFMNTLIALGIAQCEAARTRTGLSRVVLSGGVFQNRYLLPRLIDGLHSRGFDVYWHRRVSANDEGIALGQTMIAAKGGGTPCV